MLIIKRYVLRELMGPTLLGLLFFTFILFITQIFRLADILMSEGIDTALVGKFALCLLPALLSFTIPCAVLVGVLISFGRLASDNEILAIRTGGIHLMTIFRPVIFAGFLISMFMLVLNYSILPNMNLKSMDYLYQIEFQLFNTLRPGRFYDEMGTEDNDITFYYGSRDPKTGDLLNIHMKIVANPQQWTGAQAEEKQKRRVETLLLAERGRILIEKETRAIQFHFFNGSLHPLDREKPAQNNVVFFKELVRVMSPSMHRMKDGVYQKKNKEMTVPELMANIERNGYVSRKVVNESRVALLQRFSNPLACLALILIGMPLAVYIRPSGKSAGFAISFGLLFVYYLLMKWGASLGEVNHSLTSFAIFSPNILLGSIGCVLIYFQTLK
ncbi:MAG: LptF/LptG family permease [Candidatus Sumerlaeota bacterium]|nr:LptF/LptG family permease [Candidatus Sumerlaeota bacterium]